LADDLRQVLDTAGRQLDAGDVPAAFKTLEPALVAHPDDPSLLALRGIAETIYTGRDVARVTIDRAVSLGPNNALVYFARGYLNDRDSQADAAIADYTRAIELDPGFARAYYQRGTVLNYPKDDQAGAQRDFDRAIELDPDYVPARLTRGWRLYYAREYDPALADAEHVLKLDAKQAQALYLRAQIAARQDRPADAQRDFDAAVAAAPEDQGILRDRAEFLVRQGQLEKALADADKLVEFDGANTDRQRIRGFVLYALGRHQQALEAFERAILIDGSEDWVGRYGRGLALLALDRAPDALPDLEAATAHIDDIDYWSALFFKNQGMPAIDLARAYAAVGQTDKVRTALDTAVDQGGGLSYLERGRLRAEQGDPSGAREDLQEALRQALEAKDDALRAQVEAELAKLR
jgi:tetratricopeptide (TPR) repeat protein